MCRQVTERGRGIERIACRLRDFLGGSEDSEETARKTRQSRVGRQTGRCANRAGDRNRHIYFSLISATWQPSSVSMTKKTCEKKDPHVCLDIRIFKKLPTRRHSIRAKIASVVMQNYDKLTLKITSVWSDRSSRRCQSDYWSMEQSLANTCDRLTESRAIDVFYTAEFGEWTLEWFSEWTLRVIIAEETRVVNDDASPFDGPHMIDVIS